MQGRKIEVIEFSASELSRMIQREYGKEFNVPYLIMQGKNMIKAWASDEAMDPQLLDEFKQKGDEIDDIDTVFDCLLCDLCHRGKLEEGTYLIEFSD